MSGGVLDIDLARSLPASDVARDQSPCFAVLMNGDALRDLDGAQWDALSASSIDDNPFFSRAFVMAGIDAFNDGVGLEALAFRLHLDGRLVGLFPFRRERYGRLFPLDDARAHLNLYQVGGAPLVDEAHADAVAETYLNLLHAHGEVPARWAFPHVELEGPFARLMGEHAERRGYLVRGVPTYVRPVLTCMPGGFDAHIETVIGRRRAKDIQRNLRRLGEMGTVRLERATGPESITQRVEQFLAIEAAGWKGKKGTAFLSDADHANFARLAFAGAETSVDTLLLDETPIAVSVNLGAGSTLFTPKCAFDENYRKYGPGLVLEYLVIEAFYAGTSFAAMNAATTNDGHVISGYWNDARPMGTLIVGPKGWRTRLLARIESVGHGTRQWAKKLINRFRRSGA
jgi:CelD/BcsL family acetyltransferase involved in cellulose biosynthesis